MSKRPRQEYTTYDVDSVKFKNLYKDIMPDSLKFQEVSGEFVVKEFKSLNISKSSGLDGIPAWFIKDAAEVIKGPITYIVNLSLRSGIFPNELKLTEVIPLHKKKSRLDAGNHRSVSILSLVSKVLEKTVFPQLNSYLVENKLFFNQFQSGFRGSYSPDTCLIHLQDHIRKQTASGQYTGMGISIGHPEGFRQC